MKIHTLLALAAFALIGCETATLHDKFERNNEVSEHLINNTVTNVEFDKVLVLDKPPQMIEVIKPSDTPSWVHEKTRLNAKELPLTLVLRQIIGDSVPIEYGHAVEPSKPLSIFFEGTKEEALNIVALTVNYGVTPTKDSVKIDKFITRTYKIPTTMGEESFQMGSEGSASAVTTEDAQRGTISATGSGDGQFSNIAVDKYNITEQIYEGINKILSGEANLSTGNGDEKQLEGGGQSVLGYAEAIRATSSIVVRTSPAMMKLIDDYVQNMLDELNKVAVLEVTVIEYQKEDGSEFGLNADIHYQHGNGQLSLNVAAPSLSGVVAGLGLGGAATGGAWKGSEAVINALRQTGTVGVETQQRVFASNHKTQEIDLSVIIPYISSAETTFQGADSDIPVTTIEKSEARDGVKLLALANIQDDTIHLKLNGVLSKVVSFKKETINGITIESPTTRQARFNTTGSYNFNETIIVTHMRQETNESNTASQADLPIGNSGKKKVMDTLVLLTPYKVWK